MSKQSQDAIAAIDRIVFKSDKPVVVALTGGWGEGKTHFWKEVVVPKHAAEKPGYVSVFGADSLRAIRERVALAALAVPRAESKGIGPLLMGFKEFVTSAAASVGIPDTLAVELLEDFRLTPGWIVCIDDVERLSANVGFDKLLGYVNELRDKRRLKVVLIYNREPLDVDKDNDFHRYQEKVIDREIPFTLDFQDIVDLVFRDIHIPNVDVRHEVQTKAAVLALRNIRILVKARSYLEEALQVIGPSAGSDFVRSAVSSLLLFVYTKFSNQRPKGLTFEMLARHSEWANMFRRNSAKSKTDDDDKDPAQDLLERYGYMASHELDLTLMAFVQTDVLDVEKLRVVYAEFEKDTEKRASDRRLQDVWDTEYHGTVRDNSNELCDAVEAAIEPYLLHVPLSEFDFALSILSKLGRGEKALRYFEEFKRLRGHIFEKLGDESTPSVPLSYGPLIDYLRGLAGRDIADRRTIDAVMRSAFEDRYISSTDGKRLAKFSVKDFVTYFLAHDQEKLTSKIRALTKDSNDTVRQLAFAAAKRIAAMNSLNRMRMEGMGLVQPKAVSTKRRASHRTRGTPKQ